MLDKEQRHEVARMIRDIVLFNVQRRAVPDADGYTDEIYVIDHQGMCDAVRQYLEEE